MYGVDLERGIAELVAQATSFRFDGSDLMPGEVGAGSFWEQISSYVAGSIDLDTAMQEIDASWPGGGAPVWRPPTSPSIPGQVKPSLAFSFSVEGINDQVIAYTFPADSTGWTIGIKAAPFDDIYSYPYGPDPAGFLTPVGLVEIGPGSEWVQAGIYLVMIDLDTTEAFAFGQIVNLADRSNAYDLDFSVIPQVYNRERFETSYREFNGLDFSYENSVTISANSVCFVITTDSDPPYIRYCSAPGSELSLIENFGSNFGNLVDTIDRIAESFGLRDEIAYEQIISEKEDPGGIEYCRGEIYNASGDTEANQPACGSDITIGPVYEDYFDRAYDETKTDEPFSVAVAVLQIHETIDTEAGPLPPGSYRLDYWFDGNGEFFAATIIDEQGKTYKVPAVPATLVNADGTEQPGAQISTCQIFGRCTFFQKSCR
jgi:hypothetical protein